MKLRFFSCLILLVAGLAVPASLHAAGAADAKAHMRERVPAIDQLKLAGVAGENNQGFLELRSGADKEGVIAAENKDRTEVFAEAAARAGSTPAQVGKAFAKQIAAASAAGVWLQKEDGTWYKK